MSPFQAIFVPDHYKHAVSDDAWLEAMLSFERALAAAGARAGAVPQAAADEIGERCGPELCTAEDLAEDGRLVGNPAEPLVRALTQAVSSETSAWVHWGATSQDVVDTAAMLVASRALDLLLADLGFVAGMLAGLARDYRSTPIAGRTLLQHAVPTTFGAKAAGWLTATMAASERLLEIRHGRLAVQLGGAAGTLGPLGELGPRIVELLAEELDLAVPVLPWHTDRSRLTELAGALAVTVGVAEKIGLDIALLAQTEVAEVAESDGGGSSAMPQKRNPVGSTIARACARVVRGNVNVLLEAAAHEHERAAGAWQAEWGALSTALAHAGGALEG
ncbi:MAG: 3-carboxy-cis,cis-muconate cycloisomerase, partial [Actinobacteria bacterium]|nr:3-carboxy-cis,cis-muconate cycloisomerase [Actinomycetota bacterium]